MFGIDLAPSVDAVEAPAPAAHAVLCSKCKGRGNFLSYSGRVVGKCFTCDGTGLRETAFIPVKDGDCAKCAGRGEWRPGKSCFACNGTGKQQATAEITVDAIAKAFASAFSSGIKSPKLRLAGFVFSRAPDSGKNAGSIYVKGKVSGEYLGKVSAGRFQASMACDGPTKAQIIEAAANPHEAAKAYGLRCGECSCCGRALTNGESIELGIGPICRDKFGW